jgi:hypothetical protein
MFKRKIIIVAPHFPPSNLAGVHRSRLFAQHLPSYGWEPIIVTVHEQFYEEALDPYLEKLVSPSLRIEKVNALSVHPIKIVGDIGIRGFLPLYFKILKIIQTEQIDFLYIPIPSNFAALLGPSLHQKTGIPYGIDYIDPWVHTWPGSEKVFTKAWIARKLAGLLEPIAVNKASLITGVSLGYYEAVLDRHPHLKEQAITAAMPYGGEAQDHQLVAELGIQAFLFKKQAGVLDFVYAGAMLPKAFEPLEEVMKAISENLNAFLPFRIHFIGSGNSPDDPKGFNIKALALKYGLWQRVFFEYPKRISYLEVISHLNAADGTFILGSTEAHYTPSKVYQSVLSGKAVFAILHEKSSAREVIQTSKTGVVLSFNGQEDVAKIYTTFTSKWMEYHSFLQTFDAAQIDPIAFEPYSAKSVTGLLVQALNKVFKLPESFPIHNL